MMAILASEKSLMPFTMAMTSGAAFSRPVLDDPEYEHKCALYEEPAKFERYQVKFQQILSYYSGIRASIAPGGSPFNK